MPQRYVGLARCAGPDGLRGAKPGVPANMLTNSNPSAQDLFSSLSDLWSSAGAWSAGGAPVATQDAYIGAGLAGAASADVTASVTVNSIAVNAASTLTVDFGATFTATNGSTLAAVDTASLGVGLAGTINVINGSTLAIGGSFINRGGIEIARASLGDSGSLVALGDLTLTGGGHIDLGLQAGAAATTAPISGGGLVNIDNLISGAGVISLSRLDNRAGGVILASQSSDDDLMLDVGQMSNEGAFRVAAGALLTLGYTGQSHSLNNSGVIEVGYEGASKGANAHLQIAGDFTVSGSGAIDLMGDNTLVVSNQMAASFINAGAIVATASAQIGDGGQGGVDDLIFINSGSATATGAGVTLTLYTPTLAIADSGLLQALSGATLAIASEVDLTGAGAIIRAGAGGSVQVLGPVLDKGGAGGLVVEAGGKMTLASNAATTVAVTIKGASGATAGGVLTVQSGASLKGPVGFASAGGVLNLARQIAPVTVTGDGGFINLTSASVVVMGSGHTISALGLTGNSATVGGTGETLTGAHANFTLLGGASAALTGDDDMVTVAAGASLTVSGKGETLSGSLASFALLAGATAALTGGDNAVIVASGAGLTVTGSGNTISAATGGFVFLGVDSGLVVNKVAGSGVGLQVAANAQVQINGDDDVGYFGAGDLVNLTGTRARLIGAGFSLNAASGADFLVVGTGPSGAADVVNASNATIRVGSNSNIDISGDGDTVAARALSNVSVTGAGMFVRFGLGAKGVVGGNGASGVVDTVRGANFSVSILADSNVKLGTLGANVSVGDHADVVVLRKSNVVTAGNFDTIDMYGLGNEVVLGANDVIYNNGNGSVFVAGGAVGATNLFGFSANSLAVLDLTNGVGGFATANDAYSALTSDGAGGLALALGTAGTIDFVGASMGTLTAANFKIG